MSNSCMSIILVASMDDGAVSTLLMFDKCEMQRCTDITIINSAEIENVESFNVTLLRTTDLEPRITLDPVDGEIEIIDGDG